MNEHHTVNGVRHLCHTGDHYCPSGARPVPDTERRERWDAAMRETPLGYAIGDIRVQDAVTNGMAMADAEIAKVDDLRIRAIDRGDQLRAELADTKRRAVDDILAKNDEIERLRSELEATREAKAENDERFQLEAAHWRGVAQRVDEVLTEWYGTSDAGALSAAISEALGGSR